MAFGAVVAVHAVTSAVAGARRRSGHAALMLLHYTRSGVLHLHGRRAEARSARAHWPDRARDPAPGRLTLVGVPYLAWSGIAWTCLGRDRRPGHALGRGRQGPAHRHRLGPPYFLLGHHAVLRDPARQFLWLLRGTPGGIPGCCSARARSAGLGITAWLHYPTRTVGPGPARHVQGVRGPAAADVLAAGSWSAGSRRCTWRPAVLGFLRHAPARGAAGGRWARRRRAGRP